MIEEGFVADVKDGRLIVNIKRHPACGSCRACRMQEDKLMKIEFKNTIGARKGDRVNIELDDSIILKTAFLFYGLPLLGLIFGVFIGSIVTKNISLILPDEIISALFGIIIMLIAFMVVRRYNLANQARYKPKVSKA